MEEKKKDIEELKEVSGLLKADEEELKTKGIVMNQLYTIENKINTVKKFLRDFFLSLSILLSFIILE